MKPTPKTETFRQFTAAVGTILKVSKRELLERERQAAEDRRAKKPASSGRASRAKG